MLASNEENIKFLNSLKEKATFLFEHIIENGKSEEEALEMVKVIAKDNDLYLRKTASIVVPIRFKLSWLLEHTKWESMDWKGRDRLLWGLGMNTRDYKYEEGKLFCGDNTTQGYKYNLVDYVYGQERLDKGWLEMKKPVNNGTNFVHYSSEEAREYAWQRKHGRVF